MSSGKGKQKKMYWGKRKNRRRGKECHDKGTQLIFVKCSEQCMTHKSYIYINRFSHSVVSDSLRPHGLQQARPPCPSSTLGVYSNTCPLSRWCHPTISSSVVPFSSCLQSFPASGSFPMSQFFTSGGQNIGVSASTSVLPMNIQDWFPLGWTGWISLQSKGLWRVFSNTTFLGSSIKISFNKLIKRGNQLFTRLWKEIQKSYIKQLYVKKKKKALFGEICSKTSVPNKVVKPIPGPRHFCPQISVFHLMTQILSGCWLHCSYHLFLPRSGILNISGQSNFERCVQRIWESRP